MTNYLILEILIFFLCKFSQNYDVLTHRYDKRTLFFLDGRRTRTLLLIVIYSHPAPGFIKIGLAHSWMGGVIWERGVRLSSLGIIYRI